MIERKFTDEEVIKALECCNIARDCENCPLVKLNDCIGEMSSHVFALINRQRAEIAELKRKYELAVAEREANAKALIDMTAEKYPWERKNDRYEDD